VEVHAENYMGAGGPPHAALTEIRNMLPVSLHGVCMSIGGMNPLDPEHLARFAGLVERYEPFRVSEHLAWSTHDDVFFNDLLPLPYTDETLARVCEHIDQVQEAIGFLNTMEERQIPIKLIEQPLREAEEQGLLHWSVDNIRATQRGQQYLDSLLGIFTDGER